jgi:hypothetical protein
MPSSSVSVGRQRSVKNTTFDVTFRGERPGMCGRLLLEMPLCAVLRKLQDRAFFPPRAGRKAILPPRPISRYVHVASQFGAGGP